MTTLSDRPNTALVVIDMQNGVVSNAHNRDAVISNISVLVARARTAGVPVVWVQHNDEELVHGSAEWQLVDGLGVADGEPVVDKSYNDSFEETSLGDHLAALGAGRLVIAGAQTEWCIRSTLHGAIARGYDALLVSDAHTTEDMSAEIPATSIIDLTNRYWRWHAVPGRTAGTLTAAEVSFAG
ncbi:MAG: cysteine hydrolase family protein [Actinomycetota bacterium]